MSVFYTGNTGASTGPHLDLRVFNPGTGSYEDPSSYTSYLTKSDGSAFDFNVTSGRGMREHPTKGGMRMHEGIDYGTPVGTALNVDGKLLSTWNDEGGGGIMSQYLINTDDGERELLLMHGNDQNAITGQGALTDYDSSNLPAPAAPVGDRSGAKEKAKAYADMSKSEMNAAYDKVRGNADGRDIGMEMHKAHFRKP